MEQWNDRTVRLIGEEGAERLAGARVLVVGVGGVGGYTAEMLARSGVGHLTLVDADDVAVSNINRQLIALQDTVGVSKVDLFAERFRKVNPEVEVTPLQMFLTPENCDEIVKKDFDFVVDAIDTVSSKVSLIKSCIFGKIPLISSMGAGGRTDVTKVCYSDLWQTREDGLARAVRQRLKSEGIRSKVMTVCSTEKPHASAIVELEEKIPGKRTSYGTLATVPSLFGIYMANYVIKRLI